MRSWKRLSSKLKRTTAKSPDAIENALATYAEAFEYKIDRIANYLKAQKAEAEIAQREADRFQHGTSPPRAARSA